MFVQRLNSAGVPEWVVYDGTGADQTSTDGDDPAPSPPRRDSGRDAAASAVAAALAGSLYADMLHDRPRAAAYAAALASLVTPGAVVLDVGTGTGLLSILAARAAPGVAVVACDQFPPMVRLAKETVAAAGLTSSVTVHACRSDELGVGCGSTALLPRQADVAVSEILDSILLGEGALPTAVDVGARLLRPGGAAIPARGRVLAQAVACPALRACWDGSGWVGRAAGLGCDPAPRPLHLDGLAGGLVPLGPPSVILAVDLTRPAAVSGRERARLQADAAAATPVDALAVWWEVDLTPDGRVRLDTAPGWVSARAQQPPRPWTDHWRSCWVPCALAVASASSLEVEATFGPADLAVRVVVEEEEAEEAEAPPPRPPTPPPLSLAACYTPAGLGLWASALRAPDLEAAAAAAVAAHPTTRVLTLGDGPLPALAALKAGAAQVVAVVTSSKAAEAAVGRAVAGQGAAAALSVSAAAPPPPPSPATPSLLLAEPHYRAAEARPPWDGLFRFLRDREALEAAGSLGGRSSLTVSPARARVVVVGAATPDLARTASPLGEVEGVCMRAFDEALAGGGGSEDARPPAGRWLARPVAWQCGGYREATERCVVGVAADMATSAVADGLAGEAALRGVPSGATPATIDCLVFWVEYSYGVGGGGERAPERDGAGRSGGRGHRDGCRAAALGAAQRDAGGRGEDAFLAAPSAPRPATPGMQAVWLLPAPLAVIADAGLRVGLSLDVVASAELGGAVDVRARVEVL